MTTPNDGNEAEVEKEVPYLYQLVKFFTKNKKGEEEVDCVPLTWVTFNTNTGKCESKYIPPPYNDDDFELLHDFVERQALPPESWPSYPITLHGHAKTYDEAIKRLDTLRQETYAYTSDDKISKADKAAADTKMYRTKVIKSNAQVTKKLLRVPTIRTSSRDTDSANTSCESNNFSNESFSQESQDENENNLTTQDQKGRQRHAAEKKKKQDNIKFPSDKDYVREGPKKSFGTFKRKASSKTSTVDPPARTGADASGSQDAPLGSKKGANASVPQDASSKSRKEAGANVIRTQSSSQAPIARTQSLSQSLIAAKKTTKESLESTIESLRYDIQAMTKEFRELKGIVQKSALAQDVFGANVQSFATEYDVSLPIKTMEEFKIFDERLQNEKKFRKEFDATLHFLVDSRTSLSKNITGILKKHLTRELALNFTAVKASGDKSIFKRTCFCKCMLEVTRLKCKTIDKDAAIPITDKLFYHELGNALSNAFDWDGNRKQRTNRRKGATKSVAEKEDEKREEAEKEREKEAENEMN